MNTLRAKLAPYIYAPQSTELLQLAVYFAWGVLAGPLVKQLNYGWIVWYLVLYEVIIYWAASSSAEGYSTWDWRFRLLVNSVWIIGLNVGFYWYRHWYSSRLASVN